MSSRRLFVGIVFFLAAALPLSGCDDETLTAPEIQNDLFNSYVAVGNSITAGFQSNGINSNTQQTSYPVLLAEQMETPFDLPTLSNPGCPPPLAQVFPPEPVADVGCSLRAPAAPPTVNNVAVPGAAVIDVLSNRPSLAAPSPLTQFILGGRTQIEAAKRANPTFATVWIGNNDVLSGALAGDTTRVTSRDSFQTRYSRMVSQLESINTLSGAVFIGVADVTLIPHLSSGAAYSQAVPAGQDAGAFPSNLELASCGPSASGDVLIPFRYGAALVQTAIALEDQVPIFTPSITIDCSEDRSVEETIRGSLPDALEDAAISRIEEIDEGILSISLLTPPETSFLRARVERFNQIIQSQVSDDYGYVNPNDLFRSNRNLIPAYPELFENPNTPWGPDQPFGPLFSLDGVHPGPAAHRLVANEVINEINSTYDTQLSPVSTQ